MFFHIFSRNEEKFTNTLIKHTLSLTCQVCHRRGTKNTSSFLAIVPQSIHLSFEENFLKTCTEFLIHRGGGGDSIVLQFFLFKEAKGVKVIEVVQCKEEVYE